MQKDLWIANEAARATGSPLPMGALTHQVSWVCVHVCAWWWRRRGGGEGRKRREGLTCSLCGDGAGWHAVHCGRGLKWWWRVCAVQLYALLSAHGLGAKDFSVIFEFLNSQTKGK
jgi:hypothetical protein